MGCYCRNICSDFFPSFTAIFKLWRLTFLIANYLKRKPSPGSAVCPAISLCKIYLWVVCAAFLWSESEGEEVKTIPTPNMIWCCEELSFSSLPPLVFLCFLWLHLLMWVFWTPTIALYLKEYLLKDDGRDMFKPNAWCACSLPCRILWGPPKHMGLEIFSWPGVPLQKTPQPSAINKKNYHKPWDSRHVEIPLILASACFLLNFFVLGNVTGEQFSGSNILGWAHASVDRCAVLLDLWTCETALLEKKCQVQKLLLICKQWFAISSLQVV